MLSGAAREGLALLQGLLMCGSCGRALTVRYRGNGGLYPIYECNWAHREALASVSCFSVRTDSLDEAICEEMFKALKPAELELAMAALDELEQRDQAVMRQWQMRIERAEYDCALAERRYEEVDPANRLVAASLERRWNEALTRVDEVKAEAAKFQAQKTRVLTVEQRGKILALARDLPRLWRAPTTETKDRKRMLRLLIADITVEDLRASRQVVLHIRWQAAPAATSRSRGVHPSPSGCAIPPRPSSAFSAGAQPVERTDRPDVEYPRGSECQGQALHGQHDPVDSLSPRHTRRSPTTVRRDHGQAACRRTRGEHLFRSLLDPAGRDQRASDRCPRALVDHRQRPAAPRPSRSDPQFRTFQEPSSRSSTVRSAL